MATERRGAKGQPNSGQGLIPKEEKPTTSAFQSASSIKTGVIKTNAPGGGGIGGAGGAGLIKRGMADAQVVRSLPRLYSPLYEISNLQLPRDQKTINAWCLVAGSPIQLADGTWQAIETSLPGDLVLTHTGKKAPVKALLSRKANNLYALIVHGVQDALHITGEHKLKVLRKETNKCVANNKNMCTLKLEDIRADDCRVGDYLTYAIPTSTANQNNWCDVNLARLIGHYAAEGSVHSELQQVELTFSSHDEKELAEAVAIRMEDASGVRDCIFEQPAYSAVRTYTICEKARSVFLRHGGFGSHAKKFSKEVMELPLELQLHIVGAYLEGGGHQTKNGRISADTASQHLAEQIQMLCWRNKIDAYISKYTRKQNIGKNRDEDRVFWRVEIPAKDSTKLAPYSSHISSYTTKAERSDRYFYGDHLFTRIDQIVKQPAVEQTVYDLSIDHPDHSFITSIGAVNNCRHFYLVNPIVRNAINLHATYPISKFNLSCEDKKVEQFFNDMFERIGFENALLGVSLETWKMGNAFPYAELDDNKGEWDYVFCHSPDFIRVKTNVLARDPIITLVPDDALRRLVNAHNPSDIKLRNQLPPEVLYYLQRGEDIPLPNFSVSHIKLVASDYDVWGTSPIVSCFKDLMLYDLIREAKFVQASDMINPLTLVKLGDPVGTWRPSDEDLKQFQGMMEEAVYDLDFKIITHGAVSIEKIGNAGAIYDTTADFDRAIKNILIGLFTPEAVIGGDGPNYATAAIGLEVLRGRYQRFRDQMTTWIKKKIIEPICKIQDFYKIEGKQKKLIVPDVIWNKINLRDVDSYLAHVSSFLGGEVGAGKISDKTIFKFIDIDYQSEQSELLKQDVDMLIRQKKLEILNSYTLEELASVDLSKPLPNLHAEVVQKHPGSTSQLPSEQAGDQNEEMQQLMEGMPSAPPPPEGGAEGELPTPLGGEGPPA